MSSLPDPDSSHADAQIRAAASEESFRLLVDSVREYAILGLDVSGYITSWNAGAEHIKGYRAPEILGRHFSVFYPPEDVAAGKPEALLVFAAAEGRVEDEGWRVRKDGSRFWADVVITALYDDHDRLRGFGKVTRDMTERRAAEQKLRDSEQRLASANVMLRRQAEEVSESRDRAERANLEAQSASRAKSTFLATMSHEIRTPLNAVIGMTELLMDTQLQDEQRALAETVHDSGEALLILINDILDLSRIESDRLELESAGFNLLTCLEHAVALVAHLANAQGLELVARVSPECPQTVVGDESRFRQVVVNLLSNAVKFTPRGEVVLSAQAETVQVDETSHLRTVVKVRDTGIGIPDDQIGRLFQPFSQIAPADSSRRGGTGLGLAISRSLAQAMDGDLVVTSAVGSGSTFTFTALMGAVPATEPSSAAGSVGALAGSRVLVVDDNASSRSMLHELFDGWGATSTEATSGSEALQLLSDGGSVDVVVADLEMPGMDGLELASALRRLPDSRRPPVILLAGVHRRTSPVDFSLVHAVVTKPVRSGILLQKLRDGLAASTAVTEAESAPEPREAAESQRQLRVLVAEDNPVNQRVAQLMLTKLGHDIDLAGDGHEAVIAVRASPYDVVLMDVQMPGVNGLEAALQIRMEHADNRPYMVAMTANAYQDDREACQAAGMDDFLAKPVRLADLKAALARVPSVAVDSS